MTRFVQIHLLTFYPPSNLNRDDTGKPKTAVVGGVDRLRISSQSLKRAWRTSDAFAAALDGHLAKRTQRIGEEVRKHLLDKGVDEKTALAIAREIAGGFGAVKPEKDKNPTYTEQLAFVSPEELASAKALAEERAAGGEALDKKAVASRLLQQTDTAVDLAMFGRMLADNPDFNREAAVQVAHAITTNGVIVEDDYYTAVDDLKRPSEDAGAGFIGEAGYGSGVFYLYLCIDRDLLERNLGGDEEAARLASAAMSALIQATATIAPGGKQASFASRALASYVLVEKGERCPRTLAAAFARPVDRLPGAREQDPVALSIGELDKTRAAFDRAYGPASSIEIMDVGKGAGTLTGIAAFAADPAGFADTAA